MQATTAQLGCCSISGKEPYSTRILRTALADPANTLAVLQMTCAERQRYIQNAVHRMALLLPKYNSDAPTTSLGQAREQLHAVVDQLS